MFIRQWPGEETQGLKFGNRRGKGTSRYARREALRRSFSLSQDVIENNVLKVREILLVVRPISSAHDIGNVSFSSGDLLMGDEIIV